MRWFVTGEPALRRASPRRSDAACEGHVYGVCRNNDPRVRRSQPAHWRANLRGEPTAWVSHSELQRNIL